MEKINVLITGIGGASVGEQLLKALRSSYLFINIVGTDTSELCANKNEVDQFELLPRANDSNYLAELHKLCEKHDTQIIFPGSEPELLVLSKARKELEVKGIILPINPDEVISICSDKNKTVEFFKNNGYPYPKSEMITSEEDLSKVDFFPVILKPSVGSGGSANIMIAQDQNELKVFTHYLLLNKVSVMAQEYVGTSEDEYTAGVLTDPNGEIINSIVMRRIIRYGLGHNFSTPNRTAKTELGDRLVVSSGLSQGEFIPRSEINEICEDIARKIGAKNAINIQGRMMNGKFYVFEINPRYSGTTNSRATTGYNEPEAVIRMQILKEKIEKNFSYKTGYVLRSLKENLI